MPFIAAEWLRLSMLTIASSACAQGARVLATTVASCARELSVLMVLLIIDSILIASAVFFCENPNVLIEESDFDSIMTSMYFAIITVTTVGYGDYSPTTVCGECVACFGALSGVFVLGLPISIIGVKFQERYYDVIVLPYPSHLYTIPNSNPHLHSHTHAQNLGTIPKTFTVTLTLAI